MSDLDLARILEHLARLFAAFTLAFPLGWERGKGKSSVGFRTFPIVSMASCGYGLLAQSLPDADIEAQARLIQGLIAGIGFIGGGAILKDRGHIQGLVTAASIWNTGAIGAAVAFQRAEIAVALSVMNVMVLVLLTPLVERGDSDNNP